jgi:hypothetical protein
LCSATISASIIAANVWKNSLKNVKSDNNKILYETLLDFLQRNGTYFLNKPRNNTNAAEGHRGQNLSDGGSVGQLCTLAKTLMHLRTRMVNVHQYTNSSVAQ